MSELSDRELNVVRLQILDIIKSFFIDEPDQAKVETWQNVISMLNNEQITPGIDTAVRNLNHLLSTMRLEELKDEYYELFTNPFSEHLVQTTLSYYVDGHDFGQSLVDLRRFLLRAEITKIEGLDQSEDSLVFLVDILSTLIHDEELDPDTADKKQTELLSKFLDPFSVHFTTALKQNQRAVFYEACAAFLTGYVDLEKGLVSGS